MADDQLLLPIIDSHIHLFPESEAPTLSWYDSSNPLSSTQHSAEEYNAATKEAPSLLGYILVETDRKADLESGAKDGSGWEGPLQEIRWMRRIVTGEPKEGEGHTATDKSKCLALVPWAPLPSGVDALKRYLEKAEETAGTETWAKVKGFRFLVQTLPHGTMLTEDFIQGLRYLGKKGFTFDVGVDQHRRGKRQLEELVEMIDRAHEGVPEDEKVKLVINHLCKPDLTIYNVTSDPSFHAWRTAMYTLSKSPHVYMKLSGVFSELPDSVKQLSPSEIFQSTLAWLGIILATFGPSRIMFASDWPVCTPGLDDAWIKWRDVVEKMCWMASLSDEERAMILGGTAKKVYRF